MKATLAFVISFLVLCTAIAHSTVISLDGPVVGVTGIDGLAEGWSMGFNDTVSVAAQLANGGGLSPATGNIAYLTMGTLPSLTNIIASTSFTLPGNYAGTFSLFPDVPLNAGSYWLIFSSPGPPNSYANWNLTNSANITALPGVQFLGFTESFDGNATFGSPQNDGMGYLFTVSEVPEPSGAGLCFIGVAGVMCFLSWRRRIAVGPRSNRRSRD